MAGTETQVVGTELERVLPKVESLLERDCTFFSTIEKRPVEVISSRDMRIPLEMRPGGKPGYYNPDGGDLGQGDMPTWDKAIINSQHMKHAVQMTTKAMWSTDSNRKAVINAFRHNLTKGMAEFRRWIDSQCMTDGTGNIGVITSVVTVNNVDTYTFTTDGFGVKLPRYNQDINLFNSTQTVRRVAPTTTGEVTITYLDIPSKTLQVTPSMPGATAGDIIAPSGVTMTPPVAFLGVKYHDNNASTGSWLGFDRSLNPEIRANAVNANSSALTLPLPRLAINKIGDRIGIDNMTKMTAWTHPAQVQAYEELGFNVSLINKEAKDEGLNLYFNDNMRMAGAPVKKSFLWDRTRIDFIDTNCWGRAELHPPGFYKNPDNGQRVWELRGASGGIATSFVFYLVASFNLFLNNPAGASYIYSLAVPAGY